MENKKISPIWRDDETTQRLIKAIEANFPKEKLLLDWRSKVEKPIQKFVHERCVILINGSPKFLCEPCDKRQERKFLFSKVSQLIEIGELG